MDTGSLLTSRHIKENQRKHHKVFADFLQRNLLQGWASKAKPIPTTTKEENKSEQTQQNYSYHLYHFTPKKTYNYGKRRTQRHRIHALRLRKH